jgi:hypothetical protein
MTDLQLAEGTNRSFHYSVKAVSSSTAIWERWMDVATWGDWDLGLKSASSASALALGTAGRLVPKNGPTATFKVTEFDPGVSYAFATKMPGGVLIVRRTITAFSANHVEFRHDVWFDGPLAWLWSALYGKRFRQALPPTMRTLAASVAKQQ